LSELSPEFSEGFLKAKLLFLEDSLSVDQLKELSSGEDNGILEVSWHKVASPVVFTDDLLLFLLNISHIINTFVRYPLLELINSPLDFLFLDLLPLFHDRLI
jgi:hypothetical protein